MKKTIKIVAISALLFAGVSYYGRKKYIEANEVLSQLKVSIGKLSNFSFKLPNVSFTLKLKILNPTNIDFGATVSSKISIKKIRLFTQANVFLAEANTNISNIDLPAQTNSDFIIDNVQINLTKAFEELGSNLQSYISSDYSNLKYKIDIDAFGKMITLDA